MNRFPRAGAERNTAKIDDVGDMNAWRGIAEKIVPDASESEQNEVATLLYEFADGLSTEYPHISRICNKHKDNLVGVTCSFQIDRRTVPGEAQLTMNYAEKYGRRIKKQLPDPNSPELPLDPPVAVGGGDGEGTTTTSE
jgi:hypothetical protein